MADVIRFDANRREKRLLLLQAVGRLMQCSACHARCTRCGMGLDDAPLSLPEHEIMLCPTCAAEYEAYQDRLTGRGDPELFWLNEAWMETWSSWLDHQKAVAEFKQSKEYLKLINDPPAR